MYPLLVEYDMSKASMIGIVVFFGGIIWLFGAAIARLAGLEI